MKPMPLLRAFFVLCSVALGVAQFTCATLVTTAFCLIFTTLLDPPDVTMRHVLMVCLVYAISIYLFQLRGRGPLAQWPSYLVLVLKIITSLTLISYAMAFFWWSEDWAILTFSVLFCGNAFLFYDMWGNRYHRRKDARAPSS